MARNGVHSGGRKKASEYINFKVFIELYGGVK